MYQGNVSDDSHVIQSYITEHSNCLPHRSELLIEPNRWVASSKILELKGLASYVFNRCTDQIAQVRSSSTFGAAIDYDIATANMKSAQALLELLSLAKSFSKYFIALEAISLATQSVRLRTLILNCIHEDHLQSAVISPGRTAQHFAYVLANVSPSRSVCGQRSRHAAILIFVRAFEYEYQFTIRRIWWVTSFNKSRFNFEFVQFRTVSGYVADILVLADACLYFAATAPNLLGVRFKNACNILHHDLLTEIILLEGYISDLSYQRLVGNDSNND